MKKFKVFETKNKKMLIIETKNIFKFFFIQVKYKNKKRKSIFNRKYLKLQKRCTQFSRLNNIY